MVVLDQAENHDEPAPFHIKGDVETRVELYELRQQDLVVDAYQQEKHFACQFARNFVLSTSESAIAEVTLREIVNLPDGSKAQEAVFCDCKVSEYQCISEKGKLILTGKVEASCLWKDTEGGYHTTKETAVFRSTVDMEKMTKSTKVSCRPVMKQGNLSLLNEKQLELNCSLLLCCESDNIEELVLLENPGFVLDISQKEYPMAVVTTKQGEELWDLAKRYRTTVAKIREVNHLSGNLQAGQKLLVIK